MKIVNRKEFLELQPGALFSTYAPCHFGPLRIKGETIWHDEEDSHHDFYYQCLEDSVDCDSFTATMCEYKEGQTLRFNLDIENRDGLFDGEQKFAVWDREDAIGLIRRLNAALLVGYPTSDKESAQVKANCDLHESYDTNCPLCLSEETVRYVGELKREATIARCEAFDEVRYYLRGIGPHDNPTAGAVDEFCTRKIVTLGGTFDDDGKFCGLKKEVKE